MRTELKREGERAYFVLSEVDPALQEVAGSLYGKVSGGIGLDLAADTPNLQRIYAKWSEVVGDFVLQKSEGYRVPWEAALLAFAERVKGQGVDWWLAGSAAMAVRGIAVQPGDLDIIVNNADDTFRLAALFVDETFEPLRDATGWVSEWFGRVWLGACVDVAGVTNDNFGVGDFGPTAARQVETVCWQGIEVRVPPVAIQRDVNERRGRVERVAAIDGWLAAQSEVGTL